MKKYEFSLIVKGSPELTEEIVVRTIRAADEAFHCG